MIATTIVARNYVAHARVLAASFRKYHPRACFVTLVIDGDENDRASLSGLGTVALPADLGLDPDEWAQMAGIYTVLELATAVKPALLRWLLNGGVRGTGETGPVAYLDPDVVVYGPFPEVYGVAERSGIAVTPHVLHPMPRDGLEPDEGMIMRAGLFNLGFIVVGTSAGPFLDWWHERLRLDAIVDPANGLFTDQRWVDWLPSLFSYEVLRDHGLNVAYWNVHERPFTVRADGAVLAAGEPLKFFHFSGFDPDRPLVLSKHAGTRSRVLLSDHPIVARLCRDYIELLAASDHAAQRTVPYGFASTRNGVHLTPVARAAYRTAIKDATTSAQLPPSPFAADGGEAFTQWLMATDLGPPELALMTWQVHLWQQRPDLQAAFPDLEGNDAYGYRHWLDNDPVAESLHADLHLPARPRSPTRPSTPPRSLRRGGRHANRVAEPTGFGWNVVGYHAAEQGVGEAGRRMNLALEHAGIPTELVAVSADSSRQQHRIRRPLNHTVVHRRSLYCVNADQLPHAVAATDPSAGSDGSANRDRRIGLWFWEVDQFPERWMSSFDLVDEVWCASPFTAAAIGAVAPVPVRVIPLPVSARSVATPFSRTQLGLPEGFVFLCVSDFHSVFERKNPLGSLAAYVRAFGPDDGATLVLKSINGVNRPTELDRLRRAAAHRPDVIVVDGYVDAHRVQGLIEHCDCMVSLHRSEGFGLNLASAMATARPVIATGYSGNLTFMDQDSAFLVPYDLVPVGTGRDPYPATANWADPDLDAAAALMRRVFDDPAGAAIVGKRGRATVLERNGLDRAGAVVKKLLMHEEPWWDAVPTLVGSDAGVSR